MLLPDICRPSLQSKPLTGLSDLGRDSNRNQLLVSCFKAVFPRIVVRELRSRFILQIILNGLEAKELKLELEDGSARLFGFVTSADCEPMAYRIVMHRFSRQLRLPGIRAGCSAKTVNQNGDVFVIVEKEPNEEDAA